MMKYFQNRIVLFFFEELITFYFYLSFRIKYVILVIKCVRLHLFYCIFCRTIIFVLDQITNCTLLEEQKKRNTACEIVNKNKSTFK